MVRERPVSKKREEEKDGEVVDDGCADVNPDRLLSRVVPYRPTL